MRPGRSFLLLLFLCVPAMFLPALPAAYGDGPSVGSLLDTLRYDPDSPTALVVLDRLGRSGAKGWKALASLAVERRENWPELAEQAARILGAGREPARVVQAGRVYDRLPDGSLREILAMGLARVYPTGADRLHAHVRRNAPGSLNLLRELAVRGIPRDELEAAGQHDDLSGLATSLLEGRPLSKEEVSSLPRARQAARLGLDPRSAGAFVAEFRAAPSLPLLGALAEVLREADAEAALGAHCLLLHVSGLDLAPDAELWRSWIAGREDEYVPPDPASEGAIAAAVRRGVDHLRRDLLADGVCYHAYRHARDTAVGATALAVLALLSSGVPRDDPAIVKAIDTTLLVFDRGGRPGLKAFPKRWETYTLAILAMAMKRLDRERMEDALVAVRDRLANGVLANGQWTYTCPSGTTANRPASGDNSNTQYANLGLRALRAAGIELSAGLWDTVDAHWRSTQQDDGAWGYRNSGRDHRRGPVQMTASGIAGLAIAHEGKARERAAESVGKDESIAKGLRWLGRSLLLTDFHLFTPYTLYAVERACVLTRTRAFAGGGKTVDWYREGAWRLLRTQNDDGSWGHPSIRRWESQGFGKVPSTAFALLFLTKATATIGDGQRDRVVAVSVTPQEVETPPPNRSPDSSADPAQAVPWQVPAPAADATGIHLGRSTVWTRTGDATIEGRLSGPWTRFQVNDREVVQVDATGHFSLNITVAKSGPVALVVTDQRGKRVSATVDVRIDTTPPRITLSGPATRHVGRQRLLIESNEVLDGVKVGRYFFPADDRKVWITAELGEHTRQLVVNAFDRVGNKTREAFPVEVVNRVLVLDGKSALRIDLPDKPPEFTLECWVRTPAEKGTHWILSDVEHAGIGIYLQPKEGLVPTFWFQDGKARLAGSAKKPLKKNRWTHLAFTGDGTLVRLWVNGKLAAEAEPATYKRSRQALMVGAEPDRRNRPRTPFTGAIDEVRFSSVCRYAKNFTPAFSHSSDRHTIVLLHFDTDTEKAILDASGEHHHATPLGTPKIVAERR